MDEENARKMFAARRENERKATMLFEEFGLGFSVEETMVFRLYILPRFVDHQVRAAYRDMRPFYRDGDVLILDMKKPEPRIEKPAKPQSSYLHSCLDTMSERGILSMESEGNEVFYRTTDHGLRFFAKYRELFWGERPC